MAGTPMFVVKAYLPVNESFGKCQLCILQTRSALWLSGSGKEP